MKSFIHQIITMLWPRVSNSSGVWKYSNEQGRPGPCSHGVYFLVDKEKQIEKWQNYK